MNENIMAKINKYSDAYAQSLWERFTTLKTFSPKEVDSFQEFYRTLSAFPDMSVPENLSTLFSSEILDALPMSFFHPDTTSDLFINCHGSLMNGFVHTHDFFEIIYVCKGDIINWVDASEIILKQGELCIHNPNARHAIRKMDEQSDFVINILLPPEIFQRSFYATMHQNRQLDEFFHNFALSPDSSSNYMAFHNTSPRVDTIIELLVEEYLRGAESSRFILESTLVVLFGELIRNIKLEPFLQQLVDFVQKHISHVDMALAASHFGYHKNYFPNLVKEHTGRTFLELVTDIRLQKSVTLLLFSEQSVEEISENIGYKSTASFYHHFRKAYGMTPNEYRKMKH